MKYDFKDQNHREALHLLGFTDEELDKEIKKLNDPYFIKIGFAKGNTTVVWLNRDSFKETREYKPNEWNPYPEVKPSKEGNYCVTIKETDERNPHKFLAFRYYFEEDGWDTFDGEVILAFKAMPEMYHPESKE